MSQSPGYPLTKASCIQVGDTYYEKKVVRIERLHRPTHTGMTLEILRFYLDSGGVLENFPDDVLRVIPRPPDPTRYERDVL